MREHKSTVRGESPIFVGRDARELLLEQIERVDPDKVFMIADRTVETLFAEEIRENVPHRCGLELVIFNEGEGNKNLATLEHIAGDMIRAGATDRSLALNVGGGVALNMGGLAASLLRRGLRFANVPTTMAACAQSVNTNRQAVHFIGGRNQLGVYRAPEFTLVDPFFLEEEPERQIRAGLVDFVRNALILGEGHYDAALRALGRADFARASGIEATLEAAVAQNLALGRLDPSEEMAEGFEHYGPPLDRALESLSDGALTLAEARWHALFIAGRLAELKGLMSAGERERHDELLRALGLGEAPMPGHLRVDRLIYKLHGNNKTERDGLAFYLLEGVGRPANGGEPVLCADAEVARAFEVARGAAATGGSGGLGGSGGMRGVGA